MDIAKGEKGGASRKTGGGGGLRVKNHHLLGSYPNPEKKKGGGIIHPEGRNGGGKGKISLRREKKSLSSLVFPWGLCRGREKTTKRKGKRVLYEGGNMEKFSIETDPFQKEGCDVEKSWEGKEKRKRKGGDIKGYPSKGKLRDLTGGARHKVKKGDLLSRLRDRRGLKIGGKNPERGGSRPLQLTTTASEFSNRKKEDQRRGSFAAGGPPAGGGRGVAQGGKKLTRKKPFKEDLCTV